MFKPASSMQLMLLIWRLVVEGVPLQHSINETVSGINCLALTGRFYGWFCMTGAADLQ